MYGAPYKDFKDAELEIDSAAQSGITEKEKQDATSLRNFPLSVVETLMSKATRTEVENGGLILLALFGSFSRGLDSVQYRWRASPTLRSPVMVAYAFLVPPGSFC